MQRWIMYIVVWFSLFASCVQIATSEPNDVEPILVIDPQGHSAMINDVMFTPDGKTLVSVSDDKTISMGCFFPGAFNCIQQLLPGSRFSWCNDVGCADLNTKVF